mmetsp:Transcript_101999/g.284743  ORF Transcript_101999/g.284743 Transcript_101999/m.284743 type:complete len:247 (-) Transcript_101999:1176-1916(-)
MNTMRELSQHMDPVGEISARTKENHDPQGEETREREVVPLHVHRGLACGSVGAGHGERAQPKHREGQHGPRLSERELLASRNDAIYVRVALQLLLQAALRERCSRARRRLQAPRFPLSTDGLVDGARTMMQCTGPSVCEVSSDIGGAVHQIIDLDASDALRQVREVLRRGVRNVPCQVTCNARDARAVVERVVRHVAEARHHHVWNLYARVVVSQVGIVYGSLRGVLEEIREQSEDSWLCHLALEQ